jgi:deoxyadenosine/deoxycytidine kinase
MTKHIVVVAGNIGVGKTSLTERIGSRLNWWTGYESVADNPYLADFYGDMRAWAFHLQVFFLGHRAEQYLEAVRDPRSAILDRSIYEDFYIFARALHHMGDVAERDDRPAASKFADLSEGARAGPDGPHSPPRPQYGNRNYN